MSKYEVIRRAKTHGLSLGTHKFEVGQILDDKDYTKTTIAHFLTHGIIRPLEKVSKQKSEV